MENFKILRQLSVFLENEPGTANEVTRVLAKHGINIIAYSLTGTADYGLFCIIPDKVDDALHVLKENHFAVVTTDVMNVDCPNFAGSLANVLDFMAKGGVSIEYMYAYQSCGESGSIIRPTDIEKCRKVLSEYKNKE